MDSSISRPGIIIPATLFTSLALARDASAYTIATAVSEGCHEMITSEALRRVRAELPAAAPMEATENELALIDDLHFTPDDDMRDLGAVTLLIGVRDNDLKGHASDDLNSLAEVHGDPHTQHEHCLRARHQDEPGGSTATLKDCRAFIERRVAEALDGLDDQGRPDPNARTTLRLHLGIRGVVDAELPTYYVRMGQALHAVEDGFSHSYRTEDATRVVVSLNWVDVVDGTHLEPRDGPPHSTALDECDDADDFRRLRRERATDAATEVLRATLKPNATREEKMEAARAVLDQYLSYEAGCTASNGWCDAPEATYDAGCACDAAGAPRPAGLGAAAGLAAVAAFASRRRRARGVLTAAFALGLSFVAPRLASAEPGQTSVASIGEQRSERADQARVEEPGPEDPDAVAWGGALTTAASVDKGGLAVGAGARVRLHRNWALGLDGEWNPTFSITGGDPARPGMFNAYITGILRFPLPFEDFNLRTSVSAGTSVLLHDLYGAPKGSVGAYVGANLLAVEYKASKALYVVFAPLGFALPVPQLQGVPFLYPQYRLGVSFEFYGS